jgi:hypothetical protein
MAASRDVEIRFTGDTTDLEASLGRCLALAERFRKVWGDAPRPDGLERLTVQPGDVLVLRYDGDLDADEVERVKRVAESWFPTATVAVLTGGLRVEAVLGEA